MQVPLLIFTAVWHFMATPVWILHLCLKLFFFLVFSLLPLTLTTYCMPSLPPWRQSSAGWAVRSGVKRVSVSGGKLGRWWGSQVLETACNPEPVQTNLLYSLLCLLYSDTAFVKRKKKGILPVF